jgi:hypothetical protein
MVAMEVIAAFAHEDGLDGDLAIQCALLHDVIEDTDRSHEDLIKKFGSDVADGVLALSNNSSLNSKQDKMTDSLARIKQQPKEVWVVKLADRITNLQPPPGPWDDKKIDRCKGRRTSDSERIGTCVPLPGGTFARQASCVSRRRVKLVSHAMPQSTQRGLYQANYFGHRPTQASSISGFNHIRN